VPEVELLYVGAETLPKSLT